MTVETQTAILEAIDRACLALSASHNLTVTDRPDLPRDQWPVWALDHRRELDALERAKKALGRIDLELMMDAPKLMLVEWVDSAQPVSGWHFLDEAPDLDIVRCVSVGWLVKQDERALMLAPNIGDFESGGTAQGSGFIRIPRVAVTRLAELTETA